MKNKLRIKWPLIISLAVIASVCALMTGFSVLTYNINVYRLNKGEAPVFVYRTNSVNDGGTEIYRGLGYHVIAWHSLIENTSLERDSFGEPADMDAVYVCGWDIRRGSDWNTIHNTMQDGPSPERTFGYHFEC